MSTEEVPAETLAGLYLLTARLTIDRAALAAAARHEPRGIEHLWGSAFTIDEKRGAR
jgi:hypothetical protein